MPDDMFRGLPMARMNEVYWQEIDQITKWVRACIFNLMHSRTVGVLDSFDNLVVCAMQLRQLIEICVWAVYYQFAQTTAFNVINRMLARGDIPTGIYTCKSLEEFVRGAVAPDPQRAEALERSLSGQIEAHKLPENYVTEIKAAVVKQMSVLRHVAGTFDKACGKSLARYVDVAEFGYNLCCGLVHPTPLLFQVSEGWGEKRAVEGSIRHSVVEILSACDILALNLYFHEQFESVKFWSVFRKLLPSGTNSETLRDLKLPELDEMKKVYSPIAFNVLDGTRVVIFDQNRRKK